MLRWVFRTTARFDVGEVNAHHRSTEARAEGMRIAWLRGENVSSDYGLLNVAAPFAHGQSRGSITIVLEGDARFEERSSRAWLRPGALAVSDQGANGTEAFAGPVSSYLVFEWDPACFGVAPPRSFQTTKLDARDLDRVRELALDLEGPHPAVATSSIVALLRANGLALAPVVAGDLVDRTTEADRALTNAVQSHLSRLELHPSIDDVVAELGWSSRHVNRRLAALAKAYSLPWEHWRSSLHQARMMAALRLASVGAATELVSRKTGFRSPTALCHEFAKAGLPSPGALARAARAGHGVLDAWSAHMRPIADHMAAE